MSLVGSVGMEHEHTGEVVGEGRGGEQEGSVGSRYRNVTFDDRYAQYSEDRSTTSGERLAKKNDDYDDDEDE